MSQMLSQAEIDALLTSHQSSEEQVELTNDEIDVLGEVGNISMGAAATALSSLVSRKVTITAPTVSIVTFEDLSKLFTVPYIAVEISYVKGLNGNNILILCEEDVKAITELMMGEDGSNTKGELDEIHLSAIGEAMSQMFGSASTSLATMLVRTIIISPPKAYRVDFNLDKKEKTQTEKLISVSFKLVIGNIINSEIVQLMPVAFGKALVELLLTEGGDLPDEDADGDKVGDKGKYEVEEIQTPEPETEKERLVITKSVQSEKIKQAERPMTPMTGTYSDIRLEKRQPQANVTPFNFTNFERQNEDHHKQENIDFIMDLPLQLSIELGRVKKTIKEILEFSTGSIIELDKLAGEHVDVLVNGKQIAKGEVVVIDENFGVRIVEIVKPLKRIIK